MPWDLPPTGIQCQRSMLRFSQAQPRQSEGNEGGRDPGEEQSHLDRETKRPKEECKMKEQQQHQHQDGAISQENSRWRHSSEFYVVRKDVNKFGPTPRCPGCADVSRRVSVKRAHSDECRNRIAKLLMDEGAQRVESYIDRTRVREETSPGGGGKQRRQERTSVLLQRQASRSKRLERC